MNKKIFILIILVLSIILVLIVSISKINKNEEIDFRNKESCLKYESDFKQYLKERSFEDKQYDLNSIFYSKKRNTCLGAYTCSINDGEIVFGNVRAATSYCWGIRDLLESKDVYWDFQKSEDMTRENNGFIKFTEAIKENQ